MMDRFMLFPAIVAVFVLQGCLGMYANTEAANEPFPEVPKNPDGVCPDFTGTYLYNAYPDEDRNSRDLLRNINPVFFGTLLDKESYRLKMDERNKTLTDQGRRAAPSVISFKYYSSEKIEIGYFFSDGNNYFLHKNPKKMLQEIISGGNNSGSMVRIGAVICDRGTAYRATSSVSRHTEGGGTGYDLETLSKSSEGELVYTILKLSRIYLMGIIPMGGSRTVYTYRYPPYTGPLPGKNP